MAASKKGSTVPTDATNDNPLGLNDDVSKIKEKKSKSGSRSYHDGFLTVLSESLAATFC